MIISIEALTFGLTRLISAAKTYNQKILLLSKDLSRYAYELEHVDYKYFEGLVIDTDDLLALDRVISSIKGDIDGILNLTDTWSLSSLNYAKKLALPMQNAQSVHLCRNKHLLRNYLFEKGLSKSPSIFYQVGQPIPSLDKLTFPLIVKDIAGTGSMNVWTVSDSNELKSLLTTLDFNALKGEGVLIESQFNGTLYSAESVTYNGETKVYAITSRILSHEPYFREEMAASPVEFPPYQADKITHWVKSVLKAIDYNHGMSHLEFMITSDGLEVIEINPRVAGAQVTESICQAFDYNILSADIELALGLRPKLLDINLALNKGMACGLIYATQEGIFSHIEGLERLALATGDVQFYPTANKGKVITNIHNQTANLGLLLASGESSEQALLNVAAALGRVRPVIE